MDTTRLQNILNEEDFLPYDEGSTLEKLREVLHSHPQLKDHFDSQLKTNENWVKKANNNQVFFIVRDDRWKNNIRQFEPSLMLKLVGPDKCPVISINF